jgi:diadenylate cyclase
MIPLNPDQILRASTASRLLNWTTVSVVLDVLLVSWLIYRSLLLVRGTRAQPMLMGLGIIVLVYIASRFFGLVTLNWILGNFLGSVILVIVVLFQDDLRRALIKVGLTPGLGAEVPHELESSIREISDAAAELGQKKIGALIVIKRDIGLEEYTEQAVPIGAAVSRQLLLSIFHTNSPLHDGAVIIEGGKIAVAGAVLPLTFNPLVSSSYGTRHRAAIGLSERTDAVIVVVSEETGNISLVREGRITRDLTERTLHNALHRLTLFRQNRRRRQMMRRFILFGRKDAATAEGDARHQRAEGRPAGAAEDKAESIHN